MITRDQKSVGNSGLPRRGNNEEPGPERQGEAARHIDGDGKKRVKANSRPRSDFLTTQW
jgi:hypothetical protein